MLSILTTILKNGDMLEDTGAFFDQMWDNLSIKINSNGS